MRRIIGSTTGGLVACGCAGTLLVAAVAMTAQASGTDGRPVARRARRVQFVEVAKLRFHGEKGAAVVDVGQASGTYDAPLTVEMTLHATYVSAVVTVYPRGGSITGTARANFKSVKNLLYFGGLFTLGRGTGKFRDISEIDGKALGFSGVLNHETYSGEVKAHGEANE
jgi:hypothetical protein